MQDDDCQTVVAINQEEFIVPKSWNDLSNKQILLAYTVLMDQRLDYLFAPDESLAVRRQELLKLLTGKGDSFFQTWEQDAGEDFYEELTILSELFSAFAFEPADEEGAHKIRLNLTKNPIPSIPFKNEVYYGPTDELDNISLYELGKSFLAFEQFMESGKVEDAAELVAILYRPGKPETKENIRSGYENDRRLPLYDHEGTIEGRAKLFLNQVPEVIRQVIVFWFACCRQNIIDEFENLFSAEGKKIDQDKNDYSWAGVILNLAGGIVHEEKVSKTNHGTALTYLSMLEDQRKEAELQRLLSSKV